MAQEERKEIRRLKLLKSQFRESETVPVGDDAFEENVVDSYKEKLKFLEKVKNIPDTERFKDSETVASLIAANKKLALKLRRDDVFDIILANHKLDEQVLQSREIIELLQKRENELKSSIKEQEILHKDLTYLKENMNKDKHVSDDDDEELSFQEQIQFEKARYRKLRTILADLIEEYEK